MFSVTFWLRLSRLSGDRRNPEDLGDMAEGKSKEMAKQIMDKLEFPF